MLKELYIENLAVIERASIPFSPDFNIFTGETGAGKSILIHGVSAILGYRVSKELVRTGCKKAIISALFCDISSKVTEILESMGFSCSDNELILTREISSDGGSVARINNRTTTIATLKEIGSLLVAIHGQHDNQVLLSSENHINLIDNFGGCEPFLNDYHESFKELQSVSRKLSKLQNKKQEINQKVIPMQNLLNEMESLDLKEGEETSIEEELFKLQEKENLLSSIDEVNFILNNEQEGIISNLDKAEKILNEYENDNLINIYERLQKTKLEIIDISEMISEIIIKTDIDTSYIQSLKDRLDLLRSISKKYLCPCDILIQQIKEAQKLVEDSSRYDKEIDELKHRKKLLLDEVSVKAKILSQKRRDAADKFKKAIIEQLQFLNMQDTIIDIKHELTKLTINGMDSMEIFISANKGESLKPLSKVASGGELSRIMLALKCVIANQDNIPTMIFDEIDTGVSGRAAQKIGFKLKEVSATNQVICITHLSQIAVMANQHLLIEKKVNENDRTATNVTLLSFEERVNEIARIMSGDNPSELMLQSAREELLQAQKV
ncbi:MAG: DNA repair protein RecN [Ruminococcus sp.]|nr:DNA repair protein RecN [Ruminococcus sp.]